MHWLIVGNGTAHRKPTGVLSQGIHRSTIKLLAMVQTTNPSAIKRLWLELWATCSNYETLPTGSKELLPVAASHLQQIGLPLEELSFPNDLSSRVLVGKCKAIWARNALVLNKARCLCRLLHDAGVEAVAIKGVASISRDPVLARGRQTLDVDLLIPPEQWNHAEAVLKRSRDFREYDAPIQWCEGRGWVNVHAQHWRGGGIDLDLHRHPQPAFLEDSRPYALIQPRQEGGDGIMRPQTGDHLAILLMHAFSAANAASGSCFRYIAEALRSWPKEDSRDYAVMEEQLALHDNGTKIQKQMLRLKGIIEAAQVEASGMQEQGGPLPPCCTLTPKMLNQQSTVKSA